MEKEYDVKLSSDEIQLMMSLCMFIKMGMGDIHQDWRPVAEKLAQKLMPLNMKRWLGEENPPKE